MARNPGPISTEVLTRQHEHRSADVWSEEDYTHRAVVPRCHINGWPTPSQRVLEAITRAGFYAVYRIGCDFKLDKFFITALVERWRSETHTFHLRVGEATITLEDVLILLGLSVDGLAVTGSSVGIHWSAEVRRLLGRDVSSPELQGSSLTLAWLRESFQDLPDDASDDEVTYHARAYILMMMGSVLFSDASGTRVQLLYLPLLEDLDMVRQYSWGSATLATLYRQLCRASSKDKQQIGGHLVLLQVWAWLRMPIGRPRFMGYRIEGDTDAERRRERRLLDRSTLAGGSTFPPVGRQFQPADTLICRWLRCAYKYDLGRSLKYYRDALDRQRADEFTWMPYTEEMLSIVPNLRNQLTDTCRATVPLICFDIVEWHRPERVMRQFGLPQHLPGGCNNEQGLHKLDRTGKMERDWLAHHQRYIDLWNNRRQYVARNLVTDTNIALAEEEYMNWYMSITRRFISPPSRTPAGEYQPIAQDLYMTGQYVPPNRNAVFDQLSVDPTFFWSQQGTSGGGQGTSSYPRSEAQSSMPYATPNPITPSTHYPAINPSMSSFFTPPIPSTQSFGVSPAQQPLWIPPPQQSYGSYGVPSPQQPYGVQPSQQSPWNTSLSKLGDFGWSSQPMSQFPPSSYISPTRPPSRNFTQESIVYDPPLSCVREQNENDSDENE